MSNKALTFVWNTYQSPKGRPVVKFLYIALADCANDDGICWPGISYLAKLCCISERHTQTILHQLQDANEIEIIPGGGTSTKHGTTNSYKLVKYLAARGEPQFTRSSDGVNPSSPVIGQGVNPSSPHRAYGVNPESPQGVNPSSPKPLTEPSNESIYPSIDKSNQQIKRQATAEQLEVIDLLKRQGLADSDAVAYCTLPVAIVQGCIDSTTKAQLAGKVMLKKRVGYLISALRNQLQEHKHQQERSASHAGESIVPAEDYLADEYSAYIDTGDNLSFEAGALPRPPVPRHPPQVASQSTAPLIQLPSQAELDSLSFNGTPVTAIWSSARNQLELQYPRFKESLLPWTTLIDFVEGERRFVFSVSSMLSYGIAQRSEREIRACLRDAMGLSVDKLDTIQIEWIDTTINAAPRFLRENTPASRLLAMRAQVQP